MRDFQLPGRSTVHAANGMAATSHPASTLAAVEMLRQGGNAVDAAVTAAAVQAVVEPQSTGIGGDCFLLYAPAGGAEVIGLNGSGAAPLAAEVGWYRERGMELIGLDSPHAVTVPGAVDAWVSVLEAHGSRDLAQVLAPAIAYAEEGFCVSPRSVFDWRANEAKLAADPTAARLFLRDGKAPEAGTPIRQPELAETLRRIAREGRAGFYEGPVAEDIVARLRGLGGLHGLEDLARHRGQWVEPIRRSYRGYEVFECPPNGQGIAALIMLGILEGFDLAALEPLSVQRLHLEGEATRLAYWVCENAVTDPDRVAVPVAEMLSEASIEALRARIRPDRMADDIPTTKPMHPDTVYITVVDRERNCMSLINSLCFAFGSGLMAPRSGVFLQNRGSSFSLDPEHANVIAPGKRPRHTIIPGMLAKAGRALMPFGVMGGQFQPVGQTHVLTNLLDHGLDLQASIDLARGFHFGGSYALERGIPDATLQALAAMGHPVTRPKKPHGSGQAVWIDWEKGTLVGGSDPRKDGIALGY